MIASFPAAALSGFTKGFRVNEEAWEYVGYLIVLVYIGIILASFLSFAFILVKIIKTGKI